MRRESGFTLIELLIVIMIIGILLSLAVPNFRLIQNRAHITAMELNMQFVGTAITSFFAENGYYANDFYEDGYGYIFDGGQKNVQLGQFPINPYTGVTMVPDDFNPTQYDADVDVSNTSQDGPNDDWGYDPGQMRYGTYTPPGATYPTLWGLIGFDHTGYSIRNWAADGTVVIFVMH